MLSWRCSSYQFFKESQMAARTGVPTLLDISKRLCIYLTRYSGVIEKLYPDNSALLAALAAAQTACAVLAVELEKVREYGD